jgi:signal transduction histidine kinase
MRVEQALGKLSQGHTVMSTVLMMRIVAAEVAIDRTERHEIQWQAGRRELLRILGSGQRDSPLENMLLTRIQRNIEDADELFHRFVESARPYDAATRSEDNRLINERINDGLQLALGNVNMSALRLSEFEAEQVRAAREKVLVTLAIAFAALFALFAAYLVVFRRLVLSPINRLQAATDRLAGGDFEQPVALEGATEFTDLGRHFDHMVEQLHAFRTRMTAANRELEAFAYSVSHDLRAPLRGMDGFSRILLEQYGRGMNDDARHCLQMIRDNAVQMGRLIDDLLSFSRLNQQPLRKELFDQQALVRSVVSDCAAETKDRQVDFEIGALPPEEADTRLLKHVWANLIGNAIKYTRGRDRAVVRIDAEMRNDVPVYRIADNGVGFDMRYADKLFGVFQRLHRPEDYEGTGVGLAIVQRIVNRHGGRIWAEAQVGKGATFFFTLQEDHHDGRERS